MPVSWMSVVPLGTTALRVLFAVQGWAERLRKKPLRAELRPFTEQGFLVAYQVRLTNIEQELIHVADVVMTMPAQAQFALRPYVPFMVIGETSTSAAPWEYQHRFPISTGLPSRRNAMSRGTTLPRARVDRRGRLGARGRHPEGGGLSSLE
jgi:hypothetical protein